MVFRSATLNAPCWKSKPTTGPGSTNALSAIAGAWVDSIPVIVIAGQVRREVIADYSKLRQLGPQEINIIDMGNGSNGVGGIGKVMNTVGGGMTAMLGMLKDQFGVDLARLMQAKTDAAVEVADSKKLEGRT